MYGDHSSEVPMNTCKYLNPPSTICRSLDQTISSFKGNVLVYLIVVVLIFGVLGVTIVSLFTTATSSSATPNDSRRAYYVAESGIRYALSRIRNSDFNENFIETLNSTPSYNLNDGGSFEINIFSPAFEYTPPPSGNDLNLNVINSGKIPENYSIPNITLINWNDFSSPPLPASWEPITGSSATAGDTSLTITIANPADFTVSTDDIVCLAVQPTDPDPASPLQAGEDIFVALDAREVFPPGSGAIRIVTDDGQVGDYYYEERIDEPTNSRVRLTNLAALPGSTFVQINFFDANDWVVLSRNNYRLLATGKSGDVEITVGNDRQLNIFADAGVYTITMEDLVADAVPKESNVGNPVFDIDAGADKKITIGGSGPAFGDLWYGGDKPIGNDNNFCQSGRCLFGIGVRAFFTLGYSGDGEGFIFSLISGGGDPPENTANSAGGDIERSELLGYAGDSRTDVDGTTFVDGAGNGLLPPKIGLEFDTQKNFDQAFEQSLTEDPGYCDSAISLKADTRNDPVLPGDIATHAVQNVFWGNTVLRYAACRGDDQTYDDNRHEAEGPAEIWTYLTGDDVESSPAVSTDGATIYVGSIDNNVYAFNSDDRTSDPLETTFPTANEWAFDAGGDVRSSPAVDRTGGPHEGTIYVGSGEDLVSGDGRLSAISPAGALRWEFTPSGSDNDVDSSPALDSAGKIYFGSDNANVYSLDPNDRLSGLPFPTANEWIFPVVENVESKPAISESRATVYTEAESFVLYALDSANGNLRWALDLDLFGFVSDDDLLESSPTIGPDGTIYVGSKDGRLYAVNHDDRLAALPFPASNEWAFVTGGPVRSTPAVDDNGTPGNSADDTIYVGSDSGRLFAVNPDGSEKWRFPDLGAIGAIRTSPIIDSNGTIYFGSDDGRLYAVNAEDGSERWRTDPAVGAIRSSPAIGPDGTIFFGSNDNNVYAGTPFAVPRNFRDESVEDKKLIISDDFSAVTFTTPAEWLKEGPWAVRMEITRAPSSGGPGIEGTYTLKTWLEKCEGDCTVFTDGLFRDTRVVYNVAAKPPKLEQTIILSDTDHDKFERFLFGFTTAAQAGDTQQGVIRDFELTFSRPGDPVVTVD
jgi:outer membrane protein assembly factor BamB